jgi:hypothetical protein
MNRGTLLQAERAARVIPTTMSKRGVRPLFTDWLLTESDGCAWLFGVLDVGKVRRLEDYTRPDLLHHLSTALQGMPVFLSNSNGLRYAVLLNDPPKLPGKIDFPGVERGQVRLGRRAGGGEVRLTWDRLEHVLVAGMTGSGKSSFLRLLVYQALGDGCFLMLADRDGVTFPMLAEHPALLAPIAQTPDEMRALIARGLGECDAHAAQYAQIDGFPDNLGEYNALAQEQGAPILPRLVVVLDEFNSAAVATGGANGSLTTAAAELGWRGRKFGVTLIFAAQDFIKGIVGRVRDQAATVCFRVQSAAAARAVGCADAVKIPAQRPGLAITDRWGAMQTYYLDKRELIAAGTRPGPALSEDEAALIKAAMEGNQGKMTLGFLEGAGLGQQDARRLLEDWRVRGWLEKDVTRNNAHVITRKLRDLLTNQQT